ncbi:unnamed protein product [Urochloa decumbens]|uniref:AAA+ ATPase domain-containing protein n=1 Tax=Urochloa decumbens TaxID=240449 RepID=A0ABC9ABA1_9POAL
MDLVVGALSGVVDALPGKLGALLEQEYALLSGVRDDIRFLQAELGSMRAAIHYCESLEHPDSQTGTWIGRVRELAYDIEDWVDLFAIRVDAGGGGAAAGPPASTCSRILGWFRRGADKVTTLPFRHVVANELKDIKQRVVELSAQRKRYSVGPLAGAAAVHRPVDPRISALFVEADRLVGLDGQVEEVCRILMDADSGKLKFVSIVGMAGSGKTTLANVVFQRFKKSFQCWAFVSMGQKADIRKTLRDMLAQLDGDGGHSGHGGEDINNLIGRLRDTLQKKRYLIVIDDLWSRDNWATLKCCIVENNLGSRVIITTRSDILAQECCSGSSESVHKIRLLSDADARNLFLKKAFVNGNGCPQHLEDVFSQILKRCDGLPLAVVSIATKLTHNPSKGEWERLGLNSLCNSDPDGLKQILNLSYNNLKPNLKTCLLYLSIFPESSDIDTDRLVRRWVAEGFVAEGRRVSAEETAIGYLSELISRSLVLPLELNHDGIPRRCRVHPVIHDFIVCKSVEENFATVIDAQQQHFPNNSTVRRLSLKNSSKQDKPTSRNESTDLSHARSITVFGHASAVPKLTNLKVVRVLDLEGCDGPVCLEGLCKLVLLRYLSLRGTAASELPAAIGDLKCLETLDVRSTKVEELPSSIVRLGKLMHLLAGNAKLPDGITKMKALQTLSCFGTTKSSVNIIEEISKHDSLKELELYSDATEAPGNKKRSIFPAHGFRSVKKLCIRCSSPLVTFEPKALPTVQVLELRFQKGLADESCGVSGVENLSSLKHVLLDFEQHDAGSMATVDAVRKAAQGLLPDHQYITIKVDGKSY